MSGTAANEDQALQDRDAPNQIFFSGITIKK
jgi:hypothetical protein